MILALTFVFAVSAVAKDSRPISARFKDCLERMNSEDAGTLETGQQDWQRICIDAGAPGNEEDEAEVVRLMIEALETEKKASTRFWLLRQLSIVGDASAVSVVLPLIASTERTVRDEAIRALSVLPVPEAKQALETALDEAKDAKLKEALAEAIRYRAKTVSPPAKTFDAVLGQLTAIPGPVARNKVLTGLDRKTFDAPPTPENVAKFSKLEPDTKALLLGVMGNAHAGSSFFWAEKALTDKNVIVRLEAIRLMGESRDARAFPVLLPLVVEDGSPGRYAVAALGRLHADGVNESVLKALSKSKNTKEKVALLTLLADRRAFGASEIILAEAKSPQPEIRRAALKSLGIIADRKVVPELVKLLFQYGGEDRKNVENCIARINAAYLEEDAAGTELIAEYRKRNVAEQRALLGLIGKTGTADAQAIVLQAVKSDDEATKAVATRALIDWPNDSVIDEVHAIAADKSNPHSLAATRGYIRIVTMRSNRPAGDSLELFKKAMLLADRNEEKRLLLQRIDTVRSLGMFKFVEPFLDDPALHQDAARAIVGIANDTRTYLAHRDYVDGLLDRVLQISKDPSHAERIKRYRERR